MGHRRESQTQASSSANRQKCSKLKDRNARQGEERRNKGENGTGKKMTEAGENVLPTTASLELEIYVAF